MRRLAMGVGAFESPDLGAPSRYSGGKNERAESKLLAFHEFLFNRLHIHRGDRKLSEVFMGASKFRISTRKPNISRKH